MPRQVQTGFVFPNVSIAQAMAAREKVEAAKKTGTRPTLQDFLRDVLVIPAGTPKYEVKPEQTGQAGQVGRRHER